MSYSATVLNVLIASPSDVAEERDRARNVIAEWNSVHAEDKQIVLIPKMWEIDVAPQMGARGQDIINALIGDPSDICIAIFWTRIGSQTGAEVSGTVEEVKRGMERKKPVQIYFSTRDWPRHAVNAEQKDKLDEFQRWCEPNGIYGTYSDPDDFEKQLTRYLSMTLNGMSRSLSNDSSTADKPVPEHRTVFVPKSIIRKRRITSVEGPQRNTIPQLSVDVSGTSGGLYIHIRNAGLEPATIRLVSLRTDLAVDSALHKQVAYWRGKRADPSEPYKALLVGFDFAPNDEFTFYLPWGRNGPIGDRKFNWFSSLSVFYKSALGGAFRSRVLYCYESINEELQVKKVGNEFFPIQKMPINHDTNFDITTLYQLENGGHIHVYRPQYGATYRIENVESAKGSQVPGLDFTQGRSLTIRDIRIPWHGIPEFLVSVTKKPFCVTCSPIENGRDSFDIFDAPVYPMRDGQETRGSVSDYSEYGLVAKGGGNDQLQIAELYNAIYRAFQANTYEQ